MPEKNINDTKLLRLVDRKKMTQVQAAKELGVSKQAVHTRLKQLRGRTTYATAAVKVEQAIDSKLDVVAQLKTINQTAQNLLSKVEDDAHLSVS